MGLAEIVSLVAQSGLAVALVVFLTYQGWQREGMADKRERDMNDFFNNRILSRFDEALGKQTQIIENQRALMVEATRMREALDRLSRGERMEAD